MSGRHHTALDGSSKRLLVDGVPATKEERLFSLVARFTLPFDRAELVRHMRLGLWVVNGKLDTPASEAVEMISDDTWRGRVTAALLKESA